MYIRSTISGQVYQVEYIQQYSGYEVTTEAAFKAWCKAHGIEPKEVRK